ncbi:homocysteine methyltransferase [Schizosaccharomyces cryophilus OY26]|uniref:Homocysteine methyltransferase n=1 Tax=Schizosaccharomyces cryophilus (strain OY26 / ATCC MYA-4695 / CBS 11777 / NBRC 106824 / NRRL Y48691) TaxID=653667 RepID=S9VXQ6_SCHCR|nr:homocysteine methyltransferase [Schizosaccharomyces cryophilus OY26]EPY50994.1 homocysteine methyltransferase [Schizosaccharomyces cryophilus OY26]
MLLLDAGSTSILSKIPVEKLETSRLWTCEALVQFPNEVLQHHKQYLQVCDIISTFTYQLDESIYDEQVEKIPLLEAYSRSMTLALQARQETHLPNKYIALTLGSHAATIPGAMEYRMVYDKPDDFDMLYNFHKNRIELFQASNPEAFKQIDFLAFESLPHITEALALLKLLADYKSWNKRCWITCTCPSIESLDRVKQILTALLDANSQYIWGVGVNCCHISLLPTITNALTELFKSHADKTIMLYPDGRGFPNPYTTSPNSETKPAPSPQEWAESSFEYSTLNSGNIVIGGCCETDIRHVDQLRSRYN